MAYLIVGLGNFGDEYESTRHNTGKIMLDYIHKEFGVSEWVVDKKITALVSKAEIQKKKVQLLFPLTYMNRSGNSLKAFITDEKKAAQLIVMQDDIDLPLGSMKIVFNRGSGGHRGIESIAKVIKTEAFIRIKVGISPTTPTGKLKKPKSGEAVEKLILGKFKKEELAVLKKESKKINQALEMLITEGLPSTMTEFNKA